MNTYFYAQDWVLGEAGSILDKSKIIILIYFFFLFVISFTWAFQQHHTFLSCYCPRPVFGSGRLFFYFLKSHEFSNSICHNVVGWVCPFFLVLKYSPSRVGIYCIMFEDISLIGLAKRVEWKDGHLWDSIQTETEDCSQGGERQTIWY